MDTIRKNNRGITADYSLGMKKKYFLVQENSTIASFIPVLDRWRLLNAADICNQSNLNYSMYKKYLLYCYILLS